MLEENTDDFGDLVMLPAQLIAEHEDIRTEYQQRFQHILVDESGRELRERPTSKKLGAE
ncbi:UvrD-helicase domain-containing protein [Methylocystis sp. H62]|uniref:UvrD-helicase domain-containing protein n=1 Tax=Methylocystis sp. H62 TaxID=2785789 RepID=UPI00391731A5